MELIGVVSCSVLVSLLFILSIINFSLTLNSNMIHQAATLRNRLSRRQLLPVTWKRPLAVFANINASGTQHYGPIEPLARPDIPVVRRGWHRNQQPNCRYWQDVPRWSDVPEGDFLRYQWQLHNTIHGTDKLVKFLSEVLPTTIPPSIDPRFKHIKNAHDFIEDVKSGLSAAPMAIRVTPHLLSCVDWTNPLEDSTRRQFIPLASAFLPDSPQLSLDSLHEKEDSPVPGLVHRYPDKALFLATSICPVYCRFCTRSYAVGANTDTVSKKPQPPSRRRWEEMFKYIERTPTLTDIVVSGGDTYYLNPEHVSDIGNRLLNIKHIRRIRFASKGLAVCPSRILDEEDAWVRSFLDVTNTGRELNKQVAWHTHFNHPNEITWITRAAARKLYKQGAIVRNQTVLLRGVNDDVETMGMLIRELADMNIQPYYVYQGDMVKGVEDLRTPLQTILDIEHQLRGTIAGFMMPSFVVDLPGGGGKRLAASYLDYNRETGVSTFTAPGVKGGQAIYEYHDPVEPNRKSVPDQPIAEIVKHQQDSSPLMQASSSY